jgi:hypothetical protein
MSKQDIEKRLGFAAQGVKAEMGSSQVNDSATTADLIREAQRLRDVIKTSNREFDKTNLRQIKQELDKRGVLMPYGASEVLAARPGAKAKMAKRMVVDTITSGNQKHELGYESVMQSLTAGEPPHEWFRPVVRTTNLDTGKSSEKASQPHYTEKSARDWLKNYASSVKPSTDPLYAEYASNREKISKMMTRLAQARNNPEMRQKLQAESDKLDARQREVAAQLQKRKSSRPGAKAKFEKEYVLWGLPKGETDAIHQQVLSTQAKTPAQMEDVKKRAAAAGWHSFRVQILDLSKPYKGFARPGSKAKA